MKAIATLILVLFIGLAVQAQPAKDEIKVVTITNGVVGNTLREAPLKIEDGIARIYLFKNSRVKKELSFAIKSDRPKLV